MPDVPAPPEVVATVESWLAAHDELAPGTIEGLYIVGSVALDDWTPYSDIDVVAVVADPSDPDLYVELAAAQTRIRDEVDRAVDGPYVAWGALSPPSPNHTKNGHNFAKNARITIKSIGIYS